MSAEINIVCAWCAGPAACVEGAVSHGICVECALAMLRKLPKAYLASIAEPDGTVTLFSGHRLDIETGRRR